MHKISCEHNKLFSGKSQTLTPELMHLTSCASKDWSLTSSLWNFLVRDTGRMCSESLFLEILNTAGRAISGNNLFGGQIGDSCQKVKCDCVGTQ